MNNSQSSSGTAAGSPFNQPSADITLRSSDHVDFHVHRIILSQASPVFADMLTVPQPHPPTGHGDACPIVDVTEDSKTLRNLLLLCYPVNKPDLGSLDDIVSVLEGALKYDMEWPITLLARDLLALIPLNPLRVWAIASRTGLDAVVRQAATGIRNRAVAPTTPISVLETLLQQEGVGVLDGVTAGQYFRLREFLRPTTTPTYLTRPTAPHSSTRPFSIGFLYPAHVLQFSPPDVTLECPDGRQTGAHRLIIALNSPTLIPSVSLGASLLGLNSTRRPVVKVDLPLEALCDLLRVCYVGEEGLPTDLATLAGIMAAAQKYQMLRVYSMVAERCWEKHAKAAPLEAYFVARQYANLDPMLASAAAKKTLEKPLIRSYTPAMENTAAIAYYHLLEYHHACSQAVCAEIQRTRSDWVSAVTPLAKGSDSGFNSDAINAIPSSAVGWVKVRLESTKVAMEDGTFSPGKSLAEFNAHSLLSGARSSGCNIWPYSHRLDFYKFMEAILKIETTLQPSVAAAINRASSLTTYLL